MWVRRSVALLSVLLFHAALGVPPRVKTLDARIKDLRDRVAPLSDEATNMEFDVPSKCKHFKPHTCGMALCRQLHKRMWRQCKREIAKCPRAKTLVARIKDLPDRVASLSDEATNIEFPVPSKCKHFKPHTCGMALCRQMQLTGS